MPTTDLTDLRAALAHCTRLRDAVTFDRELATRPDAAHHEIESLRCALEAQVAVPLFLAMDAARLALGTEAFRAMVRAASTSGAETWLADLHQCPVVLDAADDLDAAAPPTLAADWTAQEVVDALNRTRTIEELHDLVVASNMPWPPTDPALEKGLIRRYSLFALAGAHAWRQQVLAHLLARGPLADAERAAVQHRAALRRDVGLRFVQESLRGELRTVPTHEDWVAAMTVEQLIRETAPA